MKKDKFVCSNCGGDNVITLAWVDANTNEYESEGDNSTGDSYCNTCNEHHELVYEDEFLKDSGFKQLSKEEWDDKTSDGIAYIETDKGFHIALDATFMDQVDDFEIKLPTGEIINTKYVK